MKYSIKLCISAVIVGIVLAFLFYKDIKKEVNALDNIKEKVYAFQAGVFNLEQNAITFAKNFESKIIIKDNDLYRVFIAVTTDDNNKEKLKEYFNSGNINYYIKEYDNILINNELINYDIVLSSINDNSISMTNQKMLNIFHSYLN